MEKGIELKNKDEVRIIEENDFFRVKRTYFKNGNFEKDVDFSMCDDFLFSGWIDVDLDILKKYEYT